MRSGLIFGMVLGWLCLVTQADAFEISKLKNTKEAVTHSFSKSREAEALARGGKDAEAQFSALAASLNRLEAEKGLNCDFEIFDSFVSELKKMQLPYDHESLSDAFVVWRSRGWIDDLFYEAMVEISESRSRLMHFQSRRVWRREQAEVDQLRSMGDGSAQLALKSIYLGFQGSSPSAPGCTKERYVRHPEISRISNLLAYQSGWIQSEVLDLLEGLSLIGVREWEISIASYLKVLIQVKDRSKGIDPGASDLGPNEFSSSFRYRNSNLTYRETLYSQFDAIQIIMMSDLLKKSFERMDATRADLVFTRGDQSEVIPLSPMGQYYFARKLLKKSIDDLNRSSLFAGSPFSYEDVVTAALETGLIQSNLISEVLKIDDLWSPAVSSWSKLSRFLLQVSGSANVLVPPPYNLISALALVVVEGVVARRINQGNGNLGTGDSTYDPF
ncbi:MAG: hypothetical protein KGP28_05800 [Bdellovibrionales bacterium]|nr:hypothetical protein [Bdellovibrionales bacterium]